MTPSDHKKHRARLELLRSEVTGQGASSVRANKSGLANELLDEDTQPLSEMNQAIASSQNRNRMASLARIDAALARLKNSPQDFGLCQECGEAIAAKRLELMPYVELCTDCQQEKDGSRKSGSRKHLTDFKG